ncbi:NAD(+) diphosphatase [Altererythrobacter aerius]|uniref:NAD(+) diphosphatase n=2 Tax=Tsuneonella aeria TaxID=1837929 RepID=A0A6I4T8V8_9SPHN|nr:NAD(+) diphosphatase [Tsuneonella aeria]
MDWRARLLRLDGLMPALDEHGGLLWGTLADCPPEAELVFLGLLDGRPCFAPVPMHGADGPAYAQPQVWQAMQTLSPADLAIYGGARSLVDWHARHRFCARCGGGTSLVKGGWQRDCDGCGAQHFPRTDPVTIMLVEHADRLLLGRQPRFPPRMFSALAGFVEPGETIEEAVAREVLEEAGVRVRRVRYLSSQPWPFPSQLMIGCHAIAQDDALTIDTTELEEARWFTRAELLEARAAGPEGTGDLIFPRSFAIAHHLVTWWLDR